MATEEQLLHTIFSDETPKETQRRLLSEIKKQQASTRKARAKELGKSVADVKADDEFENELFWED
jgi:uncharacterized protein YdaU (DUF1376 family)